MSTADFGHRGYLEKVMIDPDSGIISGYVTNMNKSGISFRGESITQAKANFIETVEDYLAYCAAESIEAEQPKTTGLAQICPIES